MKLALTAEGNRLPFLYFDAFIFILSVMKMYLIYLNITLTFVTYLLKTLAASYVHAGSVLLYSM